MKKVLSLVLVLMFLCGSAALADAFQGTATNPYNYHDLTQWPVVPEGENLTISVLCPRNDTAGIEAEKMWLWNFLPQATGITFKVEQVPEAGKAETLQLRLGSNTLPDLIWSMGLTTDQIVIYGQEEGELLDLSPYINEDVMPNLMKLNNEFFPTLISSVALSDGSIYTLPCLMNNNPGNGRFFMINKDWMAAVGADKLPATLEEYVDLLYKFKEAYPDEVVLGGCWDTDNPMMYLLNAYGFLGNNKGTEVSIRDGKAVIPAADPLYKEVLALMKQFYDDGIISKDFFTVEPVTMNSLAADGKLGVLPRSISGIATSSTGFDTEMYLRWTTVQPLTSEYNDTPQWPQPGLVRYGNCALSANCPDPETVLRFLDAFYMHEIYVYLHWGPIFGSGEDMGIYGGYAIDDVWNVLYLDLEGNNIGATKCRGTVSNSEFALGNAAYSMSFPNATPKQFKFYVWGKDITHPQYNDDDSNGYARNRYGETLTPYEVAGFPDIVFLSGDDAFMLQDLESVLVPYMEGEIAKFITGRRDLNEFDDYLAELDKLGMGEYQGFYADYYANFIGE